MVLCVLGPPGLQTSTRRPLKHHKIAVLIAYLAVHGATSRERLTGLFWPEVPQQKASTNLRGALHKLKGLAPGSVETVGDQVRLSSAWEVDLCLLQTASTHKERRRAAKFQGTLCEGIQLPDCEELEQWLVQLREDTQCAILSNLLQLSEKWLKGGNLDQAVESARAAVSLDPLSEPAHTQLIKSLIESGDRSAATRQFKLLQQTLADEFGAEPSPETLQIMTIAAKSDAPQHNLPSSLTSFLGRDTEIGCIETSLASNRCVTVTGMGGVGKTQLCLEVCRRIVQMSAPSDGVWFVRLAPLLDPGLLTETLEQSVLLTRNRSQFWTALEKASCLILVDNCEHILEECCTFLKALLQRCPGVRILATSREPLKLPGEKLLRLEPLALPDVSEDLDSVASNPSVRLLLERGQAVAPDLALTAENAPAIVEICEGLDGIPLALELAGARLNMLSPEQLALRLSDRFRLLRGRPGDETRQQTLGALLDWSYESLEDELKELFIRLSVFVGSFDLCAVEDVCLAAESEWEALDRMTALVEKSLVTTVTQGKVMRYKLLQTVKQYARSYLKSEEKDTLWDAHLQYYLKVARRSETGLSGSEQKRWARRLDAEIPNMHAAVRRASGRPHRICDVLELCLAPRQYWQIRDLRTAVRRTLPAILEEASKLGARSELLIRGSRLLGELATDQGDLVEGERHLAHSLELSRSHQDPDGVGHAYKALGNLWYCRSDLEKAWDNYSKASEIFEKLNHAQGLMDCENNLGLVAFELGNFEASGLRLSRSLAQAKELGDQRSVALSLTNLGHLDVHQGRLPEAEARLTEALHLYRELGDYGHPTLQTVNGLSQLALLKREWRECSRFLILAQKVAKETRVMTIDSRRWSTEKLEETLKNEIGRAAWEAYCSEFQSLSTRELINQLGY
jgi:predicted ATPase/DNA-binding SARP family transcriptional activator